MGPDFLYLLPLLFLISVNWAPAAAKERALEEQEMEVLQYKVYLIIFINACRELLN